MDTPRRSPRDDHRFHHPLLVLVPLLLIAGLAFAVHAVEPPLPGPFYTPPSPLPDGEPGSILRSEPLAGVPAGAVGWKVLYRSTGLDGQPIAVSGMVFAPAEAAEGERPVLAWAHPTTGVADRCAPSLEPSPTANLPGFADFIAAGYVIAATDYPGLGTPGPHPYLVGDSEGMAALDSVRAARALGTTGAGTGYVVWGHSQGGQAALFTGQLAASYAPELELLGVAAAAPATELAELFRRDVGTVTGNVLGAFAVDSWTEVFPGYEMSQVVEPISEPAVRFIGDGCIETESMALVDAPAALALDLRFLSADPWSVPPWAEGMAANTPGSVAIPVPVLITQGTADTIVRPDITEAWVAGQCRAGVTVELRAYDGVTHTDIAKASADDVATWVADRFAGAPPSSTCPTAASGQRPS